MVVLFASKWRVESATNQLGAAAWGRIFAKPNTVSEAITASLMERKASGTPIAAPAAAPAAPTGPIDRKYANILRAMGMDASGC